MLRVLKVFGKCQLHGRINTKNNKLMCLSHFIGQVGRCHHIPNFPSSGVKSFSKGKYSQASVCQTRITQNTLMLDAIKNKAFIYFVAQYQKVGFIGNFFKLP